MYWRIAGVLDVVSRFLPRSTENGKSRDKKKRSLSIERASITSNSHTKSTPADVCDGPFSIRGLLLQDEKTELEKLLKEIDQFSQSFKNADRKRCNM